MRIGIFKPCRILPEPAERAADISPGRSEAEPGAKAPATACSFRHPLTGVPRYVAGAIPGLRCAPSGANIRRPVPGLKSRPSIWLWSRLHLLAILIAGLLALPAARSDDAKRGPTLAKDVPAKSVTLGGKFVLSKALEKLKEQTGIAVRSQGQDDPELTLELKKAPFWKALDTLAKEADRRVVAGRGEAQIVLAPGYRELPASYQGPFRTMIKRMVAVRELETDARTTLARIEVAWQPPFQAFLIQTDPESLVVQDNKGLALEIPEGKAGRVFVEDPMMAEFEMPLPAVRRAVPRLGLVKGNLMVIGSPKLLNFAFADLQKGKEVKQEGVSVKLNDVDTSNKELWSFEFAVKYPADGPKVEGLEMQSWLLRNEVFLLHKKTGKKFPSNGGFDTDDQTATEATLHYRFTDDEENKVKLGKPADWQLVYRTAGQIIEVTLPFEFKDVPLP